jgi:mannose-6-phosphate isomerase-like protein (cupin superfamily)
MQNAKFAIGFAIVALRAFAADPTYLVRSVSTIQPKQSDLTTATAHYRPVFGVGDPDQAQPKGVARYGELTVDPGGASELVSYPAEEQVYFVLDGNGVLLYDGQKQPIKKWDVIYLPLNIKHGIANSSDRPVRVMVMGFKIPAGTTVPPFPKLLLGNANDTRLQQLSGHGDTSQFRLLVGPNPGQDVVTAGSQIVEVYMMEFTPGGTNLPHHHDNAEEIYYVLRGHGDMVAGDGVDGSEGRHRAKEGDAYFVRLNGTIGFYSGAKEGEQHALILAVRSRYPFRQRSRSD